MAAPGAYACLGQAEDQSQDQYQDQDQGPLVSGQSQGFSWLPRLARCYPKGRWPLGVAVLGSCAAALLIVLWASHTAGVQGSPTAATGLSMSPGGRVGSFLVIGDWGWDQQAHGNVKSRQCQETIAQKMLATMRSLGDVKFIINVGDSFYPRGVASKSDPQWDTKWRWVFHQELRSVPWYSVYGNHDFHQDPCACQGIPQQCAQVNGDPNNLNYFYMPSYNWFRQHPELKLEVVGLDLNHYMWAWDKDAAPDMRCATDCFWTKCHGDCEGNMRYRSEEALKLLRQRTEQSPAKTLLVFSHYPTDYLWKVPEALTRLSNASRDIVYFGGHRHNVDQSSTLSTSPNVNWLVGGGGGWSCDTPKGESPQQGFVVGEINADGSVTTRPVLIDASLCCSPPPPPGPPPPPPPPGTQPFCLQPMAD